MNSEPAQSAADGPKATSSGVRSQQASLILVLLIDARVAAAYRGERHEFRSRLDGIVQALRLMLTDDAFLALAFYRLKTRLQAAGIPFLPRIGHRFRQDLSMADVGADLRPGLDR